MAFQLGLNDGKLTKTKNQFNGEVNCYSRAIIELFLSSSWLPIQLGFMAFPIHAKSKS